MEEELASGTTMHVLTWSKVCPGSSLSPFLEKQPKEVTVMVISTEQS